MKHTYVEMLRMALMTLNEKGGSSRQALWKYVESKYPEANRKIFLVRLKKYSSEDGFIQKSKRGAKFLLDTKYKDGLKKRVAKGMSITQAADHLARKVPLRQAKKKAPKKKAPKKKKAKKPKKAKKAKKPKKKTTKDKIKAKASANKKTKGASKAKAKTDAKKAKGDKKVKAKKSANTN